METRILDRTNYSSKTMENFEIISAYYVDIFYNHLYTEAKKLKVNGSVSSVTEGYKHTLNAFLKGLANPKLYKKSIAGLHHYFITIGFASISYAKCIDRLTMDFVPSDYFNSLTFTQKIGVLRLVLNQSMKSFIRKLVDEHMSKIIDYHKDKDNVRLLQDEFVDCLILEREGFYQRFIATQTTTNKNETVNRLLAEKMQVEIKRLVKEKYDQKRQINILKNAYIQKKESENKLTETISELNDKIKTLESGMYNKPKSPILTSRTYMQSDRGLLSTNNIQPNRHQPAPTQLKIDTGDKSDTRRIEIKSTPLIGTGGATQIRPKIDIPDDPTESDEDDGESKFIEVNSNNMSNILHDSDMFDTTMDEGTTLDDFS